MRHVEKVRNYIQRTPVFSKRSVAVLIGDENYASVLLNHLLKRGEINRITKGYYTIYEDPSLLVYCLKPAYLGLQDAMSFHNLWEQETNTIVVTTRTARTGLREVMGANAMVRRISPDYFFGFDYHELGDFSLPVSDIEKTFIDMIYYREFRKDMIKHFKPKMKQEKVKEYLQAYNRRFVSRLKGLVPELKSGF